MDTIAQYIVNNIAERSESNPLFGDVGSRVEHYQGQLFYPTWLDSYDVGALQQQIADILSSNGWGVQTLTLSKNTLWTALSLSGAWFDVEVWIDNSTAQNPETIRTALQSSLSQVFPNVTLNYIGSNIYSVNPATGQTDVTNAYNDKTPQTPTLSLWEEIFGKGTTPAGTLPSLSNATISFGTIALIIGVGYILISRR